MFYILLPENLELEECGVCVIIAWKERKSGLKVSIEHFFEELRKDTDEEHEVTNGVNPREIYRRLLLSLVCNGARKACAKL